MEDKIVLYSTGCPRCKILKKKLDDCGTKYTLVEDVELMISKRIMSAPMIEVNGETMDFAKAMMWIQNGKVGA